MIVGWHVVCAGALAMLASNAAPAMPAIVILVLTCPCLVW
jgi:hypothetical protein